jgi:ATP-grasp ribosomal peptide maturase
VLVVTHPADTTADLVVKELHERGTPVFRIDTGDFPLSLQVNAQFDDSWHGELRNAEGAVELDDIRSIYVRRPTAFNFPPNMTDAERQFATREARRGVVGLLMSLPCSWINHPARTADAEYKPYQLTSAAACGLDVPRTVITNLPGDADQHHVFLGSSVVYKTLAAASVADGERISLIYTTDVTRVDMADSRVALTTHQFQQRIQKVRDVRATVVGKQVFAVNILGDKDAAGELLDWRRDYAALRYEPTSLPPDIETALLTLMDHLGLSFAAADFVVTADEQHYFVDLNPSGQWGWIQEVTGLPIAAAIANHLAGEAP